MPAWFIVVVALALLALAAWWPLRSRVRLRPPGCCGRGCGCLLPADGKRRGRAAR